MRSRDGLHIAAPRVDNPVFEITFEAHAIPTAEAPAAVAQMKAKLLAFLASAADEDWPLTFWFSVETPVVPASAMAFIKHSASPGTISKRVVLRVVGDGAARRLSAAAAKAGLTRRTQ